MKKAKRARLERAGWKVGGARDLLGLGADESRFVDLKLALSLALRRARERRGLTQTELAKKLGSSQSRVAKMETGDPSVSLDLLVRSLLALGVTLAQLARIVGGVKRAA
jgi:DNA-binding XRE family transcriptional regulator